MDEAGTLQKGIDIAFQLFPAAQQHPQHDVPALPGHRGVNPRLGPGEEIVPEGIEGVPESGPLLAQVFRAESRQFRSHPDLGEGQFIAQFRAEAHPLPAVEGEFPVGVKEDVRPAFGPVVRRDRGIFQEETAPAVLPPDDRRDGAGEDRFLPGELPLGGEEAFPAVPGEQKGESRRQEKEGGKIGAGEVYPLPAEDGHDGRDKAQCGRQDGKQTDAPEGQKGREEDGPHHRKAGDGRRGEDLPAAGEKAGSRGLPTEKLLGGFQGETLLSFGIHGSDRSRRKRSPFSVASQARKPRLSKHRRDPSFQR